MLVDVNAKAVCKIDIDSSEAFRILCETLYMTSVLDEDTKFVIKKNEDDENHLYAIKNVLNITMMIEEIYLLHLEMWQ